MKNNQNFDAENFIYPQKENILKKYIKKYHKLVPTKVKLLMGESRLFRQNFISRLADFFP